MSIPRPNFQKGDLLTSADLNAAQLYQIDLGRQHRVAAHLPGVVDGLQIEKTDFGLVLRHGYAFDEFGRDLVLPSDEILDSKLADARREQPGADTFEILLHYNQQPEQTDKKSGATRLDETPRVEVRALVGKPDQPVSFSVVQSAPDDPAIQRPVQLGVLKSAPDEANEWLVLLDAEHRQETGVVAATIAPTHNDRSSINLANGEFAVVLPSALPAADPKKATDKAPGRDANESSKRLSITANGAVFRGPLTIEGDVEAGHQLLLPTPGLAAGSGCGLYLIGDAKNAPDMHELRLVLPPSGTLAIGAWNQQSGKFEALLTIDAAARSVNVAGDLIIEGAVIEPVSPSQPKTAADAAPSAEGGRTMFVRADGAPSAEEGRTMFASIYAIVLELGKSSGKTTLGIIPLILLIWLGLYWDRSAGILPCESINPIRRILGISPLLCQKTTIGNVEYTIAGDSSCAKAKDGNPLTDGDGKLQQEVPNPDDNGVAPFNAAVKSFEGPIGELSKTNIAGPTSIWVYCKNGKTEPQKK